MRRAIAGVLRRELRLAARRRAEWAQPLVFYLLVATLFALGSEPGSPLLAKFAPAVLWVTALLAALLGAERSFRDDHESGALEQLVLSPQPLPVLLLARLVATWLTGGAPLVAVAAVLAGAFGLPAEAVWTLVQTLLLGTPTLTLLCAFGAALTVSLPRAGVLLPVIVLPLVAPVLVFGAGAVRAAQAGLPAEAPLYFLGALFLLSLSLVPIAVAAALRNTLE